MEEKYIASLEKVGLTKIESKVYLSLIELKESQTGALCDKSEIPSSKIYFILESLIKKGFVSYRIQNNIKIFMPSSPEIIKDLFEEKQKTILEEGKEIEKLISSLKFQQTEKEAFSKYKYFEGMSSIRALWLGLIEDLENIPKGEEILVYTGIKKAYEGMLGIYEEFHKVRAKKGIKYRLIYPKEETELAKKRMKQISEVRFMDLQNEAEWAIVGDKLIIQYITQKIPRGFMIEDKIFVMTFKQVFNQLWKQAKS